LHLGKLVKKPDEAQFKTVSIKHSRKPKWEQVTLRQSPHYPFPPLQQPIQ